MSATQQLDTERRIQEALEEIPTERLFREYLHRVIRCGRTSPNDYYAVISLLDEFSSED